MRAGAMTLFSRGHHRRSRLHPQRRLSPPTPLHTRRAPLPCSVCEVSLCLATSYVDLSEGPTFFHPYLRPKKVQENFSKERSPKSELVRQTWYF
jgi:hypothetical protein